MTPPFPSWLEVDLDAVESNVAQLRRIVGPRCRVAAVVKAQAYGLGAEEISRAAIRAGASQLAVARIHEGVALRQAGLRTPILILSAIAPAEATRCCQFDLTPTVTDVATVALLDGVAEGLGCKLSVHLKVDTGLTRYGAQIDSAVDLGRRLACCRSLVVDGLYTHFASADERDLTFTYQQIERFLAVRSHLTQAGLRFATVHASNSAGAIRVPEGRFDMVRTGITMSGFAPSMEVPVDGLQPAVALKAMLARTYELQPGTSIGYGRTYIVNHPTRAGLVPLGYADGVPRALSNGGKMLVRGRRVPIIGRVSMDQCVVDLSEAPEARDGDVVTALGTDGAEELSLEEFARAADTIPHEALCRLGPRLPRVYRRGGEVSRVITFEGVDSGAD